MLSSFRYINTYYRFKFDLQKGIVFIICFQEQSQYTSSGEKNICNISFPFAKLLSHEIHQANPDTKVQWYLTWGRPNGDAERCDQIPQVCTFDGMYYET